MLISFMLIKKRVYNIVERKVKLNNKTPFHLKIFVAFGSNIGLTIRSDLVRFEYILFFKN